MASNHLEGNGIKCIIWRKDCHVSIDSGIYGDFTWWTKAIHVVAVRAVHCNRCRHSANHNHNYADAAFPCRPQLAVSVLEDVSSSGLLPNLLFLCSLVELGRESEAIDVCLMAITHWKTLDQLVDVMAGLQMAQILLIASMAAIACKQYELAHLLAVR